MTRKRRLLALLGMVAGGLALVAWVRHRHLSPLQLYILGGAMVTLVVWLGQHRKRYARRLLTVLIAEYVPVATVAVLLFGSLGQPAAPKANAHGSKAKPAAPVTADFNPYEAKPIVAAEQGCKQLPVCKQALGGVLHWIDANRAARERAIAAAKAAHARKAR